MRRPEYLSPSAIALFQESDEEYYLRYLTNTPPPRDPQTRPMAVGSAFDAFCKSEFHDLLFGKTHKDSARFELDAIFTAQVEEQHRDWAKLHGAYAFKMYKQSGAFLNLLSELRDAKEEPRFEFDVRGTVNGVRDHLTRKVGEVVLLGKPDAAYVNRDGNKIVLDWKVSGWCSIASPMAGYVNLRNESGQNLGPHKDCYPFEHGSISINGNSYLEKFKKDWAQQCSIYAWLLGASIGDDFIVAIDQLACNSKKFNIDGFPEVRVAEHRLRVHKDFQHDVFDQACNLWEIIHSDHFFRNMSFDDSKLKCQLLDDRSDSMYGKNADQDFLKFTQRRPSY